MPLISGKHPERVRLKMMTISDSRGVRQAVKIPFLLFYFITSGETLTVKSHTFELTELLSSSPFSF